jgi:hypothetical protein
VSPRARATDSVEIPDNFLRFPLLPAPKPRLLPDGSVVWSEWRGSRELVARVVDAAEEALHEHGAGALTCSILVSVKDDREVFDSPQSFRARVTPEALRRFESIEINVGDTLVAVEVSLVRRFGAGHVLLGVACQTDDPDDREAVDAVRRRVRGALDRGRPSRYELSVVGSILVLASWAAALSARYLLSLKSSMTFLAALGLGCVAGIFILGLFWVRPNVEVAPLGQTRLARISKFLGTTLAAIIVAGIVKALYS